MTFARRLGVAACLALLTSGSARAALIERAGVESAPSARTASLPLFPLLPAPAPVAVSAAPVSAPVAVPVRLGLNPADGVYERRGLGFLAVDIKDSTALYLVQGNRRAHALVARTLDYSAVTGARFDGVVVRRLGDGHLMVFPDAERAIKAALAVQTGLNAWSRGEAAPTLQLRVAAHSGRALIDASGRSPEIYGQAVERTLELAAVSRGGDVAVDRAMAANPMFAPWADGAEIKAVADAALLRPRAVPASLPARGEQPPLTAAGFVVASTLFASLDGWPRIYERYGRRSAYLTTKAFHALVARAVAANGGFVVKTPGETVMASFPNAAAAVRAGADIQTGMDELRKTTPLAALANARVGISHGRILREDTLEGPDFFGNTVNAAARLMGLARPGEILVSATALGDSGAVDLLAGAGRESVPLKGFEHPVAVLRVASRAKR